MFKEIFFTLLAVGNINVRTEMNTDTKLQNITETKADTKMQDAMELVRLSILQQDQINAMLPSLAQQTINAAKNNMDVKKVVADTKEKLLSEAYLKRFAEPFNKIFTHDEIQLLISFYRADAVKKLFKTGAETFLPVYTAMQEIIADIVRSPLLEDNITTITALNFQEEVREFKGNILLKVYSMMCEPCQTVAPIFSELSTELGDKIKFCKLDLTCEQQLSKELNVASLPTILFIKDGKIIDRHIGLISKEDLKNKVVERGIASRE